MATREHGFHAPTEIQSRTWAPARAGQDVLGIASTGSGKTAAFLMPVLANLSAHTGGGTRALILAPTRELAVQIHAAALALGSRTHLRILCVTGGVAPGPQKHGLRSGAELVIATPGRLLDLLERGHGDLGRVESLIIDEADRLIDIGFLPELRRITALLPETRQTLMFSATFATKAQALAGELLHRPTVIKIESDGRPAQGVTQEIISVAEDRKAALVRQWFASGSVTGQAIIFARTRTRAERLFEELERCGLSVARIHGDRLQHERTQALRDFRAGAVQVLVATDVAQRGIDVEGLDHVINLDVPANADDYVHRAGRTARAGRSGLARTLVSPADEPLMRLIEQQIGRQARTEVPGFEVTVNERLRGRGSHRAPTPPHVISSGLERMSFDSPDWR